MQDLHFIHRYIRYWLAAKHKRGHGIHSPFLYDLIRNVFNDKTRYPEYDMVEKIRMELMQDKTIVNCPDYGAASKITEKNKTIGKIATFGSVSRKYGRLLHRLVKYFKPLNIIELGTATGISTMYLASANNETGVFTIEACSELQNKAVACFKTTGLNNIASIEGYFDDCLPGLLKKQKQVEMAFIDGNHKKEATLQYFNWFKLHKKNNTLLIFDDIHWSDEMEQAWEIIMADKAVTISIDLFYLGLVLFRKESTKQNFIIRF